MIRLKPDPENFYTCPECQAGNPLVHEFQFESVNVFVNCTCSACGFAFDQVLPVSHTVDNPLAYGRVNKKEYMGTDCPEWLSASVFKSHVEIKHNKIPIERIIFKQHEQVVILNTLDSLYGHVLLKLYNAFYHLAEEKNIGLIIILPKIFKWLIPKGCAEVWIIDLKLSELIYGYSSLQKFVAEQLPRFQSVYLSKAYSHPTITTTDIEQLTGVSPFNLENFSTQKPVITFILREDRWWFSNPTDYWFYRLCRKLNILSWGARILTLKQNQLVRKTIQKIKYQLPDASINVIGIGEKSIVEEHVIDYRTRRVNALTEKEWCEVYACSHVVIGVHGSNMLLPTALAAGCVEILPEDRYGNMVQDISVRYNDRQQLFFYRFADQYSRPQSIANKAIAIMNDYPLFKKNMIINIYNRTS
jgi:glycosyltransferase involved in cell wall biosynthesis